ncbi:g5543 [Coccomyxa viridis]|uniref:G5543 protein n=1 Tax=Coccomyxa viridis TaxID=1274662 RepID=A0ABP1FVU8_9CHLO
MAGAPTEAAQAPPAPAKLQNPQQKQAGSSRRHGRAASAAEEPGFSQQEAGSADTFRFTPAQQAEWDAVLKNTALAVSKGGLSTSEVDHIIDAATAMLKEAQVQACGNSQLAPGAAAAAPAKVLDKTDAAQAAPALAREILEARKASAMRTEASQQPGAVSQQGSAAAAAAAPARETCSTEEHAGACAAECGTPVTTETEKPPADRDSYPLRPHERKVAAALLVVLRTALKKGQGPAMDAKTILFSNNPSTGILMQLLPKTGELPSLQQLEQSAPCVLHEALDLLSQECAAAGF